MLMSILTGGLSGILGTVFTSVIGYFNEKQKNDHEVAMGEMRIKQLNAQTDASIRIAEAKVKGEIEKAEMSAFEESQKQGNKEVFRESYMDRLFQGGWTSKHIVGPFLVALMGIIEAVKAAIRPFLALYFVGITSWITYVAVNIMQSKGMSLSTEQALSIVMLAIDLIFYLTTTAVMWYYGERVKEKYGLHPGKKSN